MFTEEVPAKAPDGWRRQRLIPEAFLVSEDLADQRVLLIDDTWVTGTTALSTAIAIKDKGATSLALIPIARMVDRDWMGADYEAAATVLSTLPDGLASAKARAVRVALVAASDPVAPRVEHNLLAGSVRWLTFGRLEAILGGSQSLLSVVEHVFGYVQSNDTEGIIPGSIHAAGSGTGALVTETGS